MRARGFRALLRLYKSISHERTQRTVILFISRHTTNDILVGLPKIYDHFLKFTEEPLKVSGVHANVSE